MSNFSYLKQQKKYTLFASAAIEAERVFPTSPALCAIGCRKALELSVKWVYAADNTMETPYKDNLQSLIHEPTFRFAVDYNGPLVKTTNRKKIVNHSVLDGCCDFAVGGRA